MATLRQSEKIGKLDREISIWRNIEGNKDEYGSIPIAEQSLFTVWASMEYGNADEREEALKDTSISKIIWVFRYHEVKETDFVMYQNVKYDIKGIEEMGRRRWTKLITEKRE